MTEEKPDAGRQEEQKRPPTEQTLRTENASITVDSAGGYVTSWKVKNPVTGEFEEILYQGTEKKRTGIPTLFPYYGEGGQRRSHGFGRDSVWQTQVDQEGKTITMTLGNESIDETAQTEYSHPFQTQVVLQIGDDGSLSYKMHVVNTGDDDMPISPGLHPYWAVDHTQKSKITVDGIPFDASTVDWDNAPPDTPYPFTGDVSIHLPGRDIRIQDVTDGGPVIKNMVVWSQKRSKPDYNFICVEPVCGLDNAIDNAPTVVKPHQTWDMALRFSTAPTTIKK